MTLKHLHFCILRCLMHLRNWWSQRLQIWYTVWMCKSQPTDDKRSLIMAWSGCVIVVKICTQAGYINSSNRMTYHPEKGRGYGHVTVLKFCRLPWCSASSGSVSDSWSTCDHGNAFTRFWVQQHLLSLSLINSQYKRAFVSKCILYK